MTFPASLITDPNLTDFDIRMMLLLDQIGWREGAKDGVVRATVEEMAAQLGKSPSAIKRSLARLESTDPPLVDRGVAGSNRRSWLRILYDRYGCEGSVDPADCKEVGHFCATSLQPAPDPDGCNEVGHFCPVPVVTKSRKNDPFIPLFNRPPPQHPQSTAMGSKMTDFLTTGEADPDAQNFPTAPRTAADLIGWLPAITDDPAVIARLRKKIPQWLSQLHGRRPDLGDEAIRWVQDALTEASEKEDIPSFAARMLGIYHKRGGTIREFVEAAPDETDTPCPMPPAPARKPTYGDRKAARLAETKALWEAEKARRQTEANRGTSA